MQTRKAVFVLSIAFGFAWFALAQEWRHAYDASGNALIKEGAGIAPPQIIGEPQSQIVEPGHLATFSVVMSDPRTLSYQWRFLGTNLPGQTDDSLLLINVSTNHQGPYTVVVTNVSGNVTSSVAQLYLDADGDGLADLWEIANFGSVTNQRSLGDFDGDGIANIEEFRDLTSPTNDAAFRPRLTLEKIGSGFGEFTAMPMKRSYDLGETVTLSATPLPPSLFRDWSGSLSTTNNPLALTMSSNRTVLGRFVTAVAPPSGLIALWRGEADAHDTIGDHHGVFYNGTNVVAPSVTPAGRVGGAFDFDGGTHVRVAGDTNVRPAQFTAEAWVYPTVQSGDFQTIIASGSAESVIGPWNLYTFQGFPRFNFNAANYLQGPSPIPTNRWTHLAISSDASMKRLYVNGILVSAHFFPAPFVYAPGAPLTIGSDWRDNASIFRFNGRVDELALYNRALTDSEIADIYAAEAAGRILDAPYFTSPAQFPLAYVGAGYTQQIAAVLGVAPISFTLSEGTLPPGLTFSSNAVLSGIPTVAGQYFFSFRAPDAVGTSTEQQSTLTVVGRVTPPAGLVGWWRAEYNALDSAATNHGTLTNGVTYAEGKVGQSFGFNGINQSVVIPDAPDLRPASITLEAWVRANPTGTRQYIFSKFASAANFESYVLYLEIPGGLVARVGDVTNFGTSISAGNLTAGRWYHVAYTFEDALKQQFLYLDGVQIASGTGNRSIGYGNHPLLLGRGDHDGSPGFFFNGRVDEAAIYQRALSAAEIAFIYQAGPAGKSIGGPFFDAPTRLPGATVSQNYTFTFTSPRGTAPITFALVSGTLPPGLALNSNGVLSGTPTNSGDFNFVIQVADATTQSVTKIFSLQVFEPIAAPAGLVAWWRAESNALDTVGTSHGFLSNGVSFLPGKVGQAFAFNGVDQSVVIPDAPALRVASLTFEAWVLFDVFTGNGNNLMIFAKPLGFGFNHSYALRRNGGVLFGSIGDAAGTAAPVTAEFIPVSGRWYHLAYVFDDAYDVQALYIDGSLAATTAVAKSIGYDTQPLLLGRDTVNGLPNYFLQGRIDEAALYNRALTGTEIASIYNAGATGKKLPQHVPTLSISAASANQLLLSWPSSEAGFVLQQNTNLNTTNWVTLLDPISDDGNTKSLSLNPASGNRFFRLFRPQ